MHFFTFSLFLINFKENQYSHKTFMHKLFVEKSKGFPTIYGLFLYLQNCGRKLKFSEFFFGKILTSMQKTSMTSKMMHLLNDFVSMNFQSIKKIRRFLTNFLRVFIIFHYICTVLAYKSNIQCLQLCYLVMTMCYNLKKMSSWYLR